MRVIVAGSRSISAPEVVSTGIRESGFHITELVHGCARGPDTIAETLLPDVTARRFPADWKRHGRRAGLMRKQQMAEYADALVAVWDGESRGTAHMVDTMKQMGKPVFVWLATLEPGRGES